MSSRYLNPDRFYRGLCRAEPGEISFQVVLEETDLWITAQKDLSQDVLTYLGRIRSELKGYIQLHPEFFHSFSPVPVAEDSPRLISDLARAGRLLGVGPMAAVAGSIAQMVAEQFQKDSPEIMVENGGDVYICSKRKRKIGLLSDPEQGPQLGLSLPARSFPCAVCSSSASIGHSVSLGQGDLVTVVAKEGGVADAAATALANIARGKKGLNRVLDRARGLQHVGVRGVFAQQNQQIGGWGDIEIIDLASD